MGKGIVYCSVCGDRILERDFDRGKAVTVLGKDYCPKCARTVVKDSAETANASQPPTAPSLRKPRTARSPLADPREVPAKKPFIPMPYIIALLIAILAVILFVFVLTRGIHSG